MMCMITGALGFLLIVRVVGILMRIYRRMKAMENHKQRLKPTQQKPKCALAKVVQPTGPTQCTRASSQVLSQKGLNTFLSHFSPSQAGNTQP